ncbi:zinc finger CCHC domain-containing protein 8 isoform X1 [Cyprinodon tularosa]|uniref:zinc finger CCHC domain-containing protein 8 isoform X1 n=1 Tax=Cyprinodon tularosa TaxID=77115 RepID=UPI0018E27B67|nr:zinc finger CCHC domain-containing protein 8 isoform X1 [Cyprinodon tularosa]
MAEVDFGDSELFQQLEDSEPPVSRHIRFTEDDDENKETNQLRTRLEECEDKIERLSEENKVLRRKLSILTRPSGITVEDVNVDGPLLQILFTNNIMSKQCRQELEDCICSVILKHQKPGNDKKISVYHMKPQNSAFELDEDPVKLASSSVRTTTEAFKVVGSVLYFSTFCVDKLGQPLVNENPQLTDGWDVPTYQQVFTQVNGTDGLEMESKKRPKSMCFNCGSSTHQLRDCPQPKDMAAINERRKEFNQNSSQVTQGNQRYHADEVEERFSKFKPGVLSEELLAALGVDGNTLPPLIYRMRYLGYPPGWLKEAEMENSGLSLYDGNAPNEDTGNTSQNLSYDVSKLVDFPGFNVPAAHQIKDEFMHYGSIPMQTSHMKQNYAAYLSNNFPKQSDSNSNKRRHEFDSSPHLRKKTKSSPELNSDRSSDMDIESDPGTPYSIASGDFQFQPPLPPASPCYNSPPPLPQGTPPATPTPPPLPKGTPPPTPTNGSPALRRRNVQLADESVEGTEDELTLEELEEQQRLIWAALEKADTATNSDSETAASGTPAPSSPSVSIPTRIDAEMEDVEESVDTVRPPEPCYDSENQMEPDVQEGSAATPGPIKVEEESPQSPEPEPVRTQDESHESPDQEVPEEVAGDASAKNPEKVVAVPHRSKFAAGIVPFEDTPEFTEVAEATGTYLRIRDLLKGSPRSLAKKK